MNVLVVDDDPDIRNFLKAHLPETGCTVETAPDAASALRATAGNFFDAALLDLNLPDMPGEALIARLREKQPELPILIFTVVASVDTKVRLFESGADDYLVKPFSFEELVARVRALVRRTRGAVSDTLAAEDLVLDLSRQTASRGEADLKLTRKEFAILEHLLRHRGSVVSKGSLIEGVWGSWANPFSESLDTHIGNVRRKLGEPALIHTVHGRGYRMD